MRRLPLRSPPRVRGKAKNRCRSCPLTRITPAHAGKRRSIGRLSQPTRDHPRVCGEKCSSVRSASHRRGSPPRMRGKDLPFTCDCESTGITPAYAGKSMGALIADAAERDHPRVCGEKMVSMIPHRRSRGSPPRMRGKELRVETCFSHDGITPAYAGKRVAGGFRPGTTQDHPRVCGEKSRPGVVANSIKGSPPRMRGKETVMTPARQ